MKSSQQGNILKTAAVMIAVPRYAGAFALSAGFVATGSLHNLLGIAEVAAGVAMAVLEGFAVAFILNKWRLLGTKTVAWWALLAITLLLALSLPMVAIPYLFYYQSTFGNLQQLFNSLWLQNCWNFIIAFSPMLVVIGVGLADVNELEREESAVDFELESHRKRATLEMELSTLELTVERAKLANRLEMEQLRANHKQGLKVVEDKISNPFICPWCGVSFKREPQLRGHKAHCKSKSNGSKRQVELELEEAQENV